MSKTLTINKRAPSGVKKDTNVPSRAPVRGRNRNNHVAPTPPAPRSDFGARPHRDDRAPRPPRENREGGGDKRDDRREDRPRASRSDFGARPQRDDRAPRPPRENREGGDRRDSHDNRDKRDARGAKPAHRESLSRAPQRHGKVRDGVREVVDGHVVRGEKRPAPRKPQFPKERDHSSEIKTNPADGIRISKYLADKGLCSRREADHYIEKGWVTVNGVRVTLGQRILPTDKVQLARQATVAQESRVTILINKP
ncbi:MAG: hypothetical protein KA389_03650, partial [Hydromonas sp.]|nr:hypothetical protein [Hydromonas sp.]